MLEVDRLVAALNAGGVDYLVIGGMAVAAHGFVDSASSEMLVERSRAIGYGFALATISSR